MFVIPSKETPKKATPGSSHWVHIGNTVSFFSVGVFPTEPTKQCRVLMLTTEELSDRSNKSKPLPTLSPAEVPGARHEP